MAYTRLSVIALPGRNYTFLPKTYATQPHTGEFTALQVYALPGRRRTFLAKTETASTGASKGPFEEYPDRWRILREDEEILAIIMAIGSEA